MSPFNKNKTILGYINILTNKCKLVKKIEKRQFNIEKRLKSKNREESIDETDI